MLRTSLVIIVLVSFTGLAHAQPPVTSFAEIQNRLRTGDRVMVSTEAGEVVKGDVDHVSIIA